MLREDTMSTYTQILYHIVFSTKDREPCLDADNRPNLFRDIWGIITKHNVISTESMAFRITFIFFQVCTGRLRWLISSRILNLALQAGSKRVGRFLGSGIGKMAMEPSQHHGVKEMP